MSVEDKPLAGKRIVVTRAPEQARELVDTLASIGAEVLMMPTVSFAPPTDWHNLDEQLRKLATFDAILFLSANAVRYLFRRWAEIGIKCEFSPDALPFVATVGRATADAAMHEGLKVNYVANGGTAESLALELRDSLRGRKVLLPRADLGDQELATALRSAGARVTEVVAYRTIRPNLSADVVAEVREGHVDAIVFASPSAFQNLLPAIPADELAKLSKHIQFAAIGPTTARSMRAAGVRVAIEPAEASSQALAAALASHFASAARCA